MPDIITQPGHYLARNGESVVIERIGEKANTPCYGKITRTIQSGKKVCIYTLWGRNGRQFVLHPHNEDVVSAA